MSTKSTYCAVSLGDLSPATRQLFAAFARAARPELKEAKSGFDLDAGDDLRGWLVRFGDMAPEFKVVESWPSADYEKMMHSPTLDDIVGAPAPADAAAEPEPEAAQLRAKLAAAEVRLDHFKRATKQLCADVQIDLSDKWPVTDAQRKELAALRVSGFVLVHCFDGSMINAAEYVDVIGAHLATLPPRPSFLEMAKGVISGSPLAALLRIL